jgi:hypothetical protein
MQQIFKFIFKNSSEPVLLLYPYRFADDTNISPTIETKNNRFANFFKQGVYEKSTMSTNYLNLQELKMML